MRILYFDCFSGISGDMTLSALLDLGIEKEYLITELSKLNLDGWKLNLERIDKNGIAGNYVNIEIEHNHEHEHHHHEHRNFKDIRQIIESSDLNEKVKSLSLNIFKRIAEAEAEVHGSTIDEVHFHEVGALDSIIDIVGAAILIDKLNVDKIISSIVSEGHGFAFCQHGKIPVPVPATLKIFEKEPKAIMKQINIDKELITPTGAGIITELAEEFTFIPEMQITKVGIGAGKRDLEIPNVLRVVLGETKKKMK